jgi:hypothetical protein
MQKRAVLKLSDLICSGVYLYSQLPKGHLFHVQYLFLSTLTIGLLHTCDLLYVQTPPPLPFEILLCFDLIPHKLYFILATGLKWRSIFRTVTLRIYFELQYFIPLLKSDK